MRKKKRKKKQKYSMIKQGNISPSLIRLNLVESTTGKKLAIGSKNRQQVLANCSTLDTSGKTWKILCFNRNFTKLPISPIFSSLLFFLKNSRFGNLYLYRESITITSVYSLIEALKPKNMVLTLDGKEAVLNLFQLPPTPNLAYWLNYGCSFLTRMPKFD